MSTSFKDMALIVHQAISGLASVCDGAQEDDMAGFAKPDVYTGHQLAALSADRFIDIMDEETLRQAAALAGRYPRQLPYFGLSSSEIKKIQQYGKDTEISRDDLKSAAADAKKGITYSDDGGFRIDLGPYDPDMLDKFKSFVYPRQWDRDFKVWRCPLESAPGIAVFAEDQSFFLCENAKKAIADYAPPSQSKPQTDNKRLVSLDGNRFSISFPYNKQLVEEIKALHGRRWDKERKRWLVPTTDLNSLADFIEKNGFKLDKEAFRVISTLRDRQNTPSEPTRAPVIDEKTLPLVTPLWKHQRSMLGFSESHPATLWDAGMGVGKTLTAIAAILQAQSQTTLVICPKTAIPVWPYQLELHSPGVFIIEPLNKGSVKAKAQRAFATLEKGRKTKKPVVLIINYESVWRDAFAAFARSVDWGFVIYDEIHKIKSALKGKASNFAAELSLRASRVLGLSGTPLSHSPLDAFGVFRALDERVFGDSFYKFRDRFCIMGGYQGKQIVGYRNKDEFAQLYHSITYTVDRSILDLPEAIHIKRLVELEDDARKIYAQVKDKIISEIQTESGERGRISANIVLTKLLRLQQITGGALPVEKEDGKKIMQQVSTAKRESLIDLFEELPVDEPVVVFCRFIADLQSTAIAAKEAGRGCFELSGRKNELDKWKAASGNQSVIAVQISSGAEGIDLTKAAHAVFYSLGFSLSQYKQALARNHRPGQDRTVYYHHLIASGTIDQYVYDRLDARELDIKEMISHLTAA